MLQWSGEVYYEECEGSHRMVTKNSSSSRFVRQCDLSVCRASLDGLIAVQSRSPRATSDDIAERSGKTDRRNCRLKLPCRLTSPAAPSASDRASFLPSARVTLDWSTLLHPGILFLSLGNVNKHRPFSSLPSLSIIPVSVGASCTIYHSICPSIECISTVRLSSGHRS